MDYKKKYLKYKRKYLKLKVGGSGSFKYLDPLTNPKQMSKEAFVRAKKEIITNKQQEKLKKEEQDRQFQEYLRTKNLEKQKMKDELQKLKDKSGFTGRFKVNFEKKEKIGIQRQGSMGDIDKSLNKIIEEMEYNIHLLSFKNDKTISELIYLINKKENLMKEKCIYLNDIQKMVRMNQSQNSQIIDILKSLLQKYIQKVVRMNESQNDNLNSQINDIFRSLLQKYINKEDTYRELKNLQEQYRNKENYMKLMCEYEGKFHIRSDF
jgi:hypothetical protein